MTSGPVDRQWVVIAHVIGPRGNRGELLAEPLSDVPERFAALREVFLAPEGDSRVLGKSFQVESAWWHKARLVLKLGGVDTISGAERWRNHEVRVPLENRPALPAGEYYQSDLVGFEVVEREDGRPLGLVRGWREYGGPALLEVETAGGGEILIPFAASICVEVDSGKRRILVELPAGLKDLNR